MRPTVISILGTSLVVLLLLMAASSPSLSATTLQSSAGSATVSGTVVDRDGSIPISGAIINLMQGTTVAATTKSDKFGSFTLPSVAPGTYVITVEATGYGTVHSDAILVGTGVQSLSLVMQRTQTSGAVKTLGRVTVSSHAAGLQTTTTIQAVADPKLAQRTNQIRMAESLGKLPEVNLTGWDSAVGDDIAIDIRGLKPSETQIMLDGHPIGPLGVYPASIGGGQGGFNMAVSPLFATESSLVTYGSGAVGLYGVDAVGGSVDMQTLNPTRQPQGEVQYGFGQYSKQTFGVQATGTDQKIGYAMVYGVTGTWGDFPGAQIPQTGLRGNDWTSATLANDTYWVSANYNLRNALGKVRYDFSPSSSLILTAYTATDWDDKTGNGDNDNFTPEYIAYHTTPNCSAPGIPAGVTVNTDSGPSCVTQRQYALGASGPAGGGPTAFQALANQDYHARFLTKVGNNQLVADWFTDNYSQNRQRSESVINGPTNILTNIYRTFAGLITDDIATGKNDLGFGVYQQRQYTNGNSINGGATPTYLPHPALFNKLQSYFIRDAFTPSQQLSFFLNAWEKNSNIGGWSFDPRLTIMYRPTGADVIRLTGGGVSADPAPIAPNITGIGGITPATARRSRSGRCLQQACSRRRRPTRRYPSRIARPGTPSLK